MTTEQRIHDAVLGPEPADSLRALINCLAREGQSKATIIAALEAVVIQARQRDDADDARADVILDVLDALDGACHPSARIDVA